MLVVKRFYHVSTTAYSMKKLGIKLNKMVNPSTKRQWYPTNMEADILPSIKSLTKTEKEPGKRSIRRGAMLNKMFMKQITDLMSTGTVSMDIVGRGIEISKVKITPDLQSVHVFWVCKGDATDEETEAVLNKIAGPLRHELSTLRVMGEVPYVVFVKDRQEAQLVDLDRRLAVADYGEDFTPTEMGHLLRSEFTLNTKLSPEVKAKIKQLDDEDPPLEEPIPDMTNNVFGLDHDKVMNRLLAARKKSKDAWSRLDEPRDDVTRSDDVISYRTTEHTAGPDVTNQRQELAEFLLKRKILQNKIHKELRSSKGGWQQYQDEQDDSDDDDAYYDGYNCDDDDDFDDHDDDHYKHDPNTKDNDKHS